MATAKMLADRPILLENISWDTYERLLHEGGEAHIRMTYDNGDLEIMTLSFGHENWNALIGRLIETLTLELNIPIRSGGSTTLRKKLKRKGLEPDECYWIQNERAMRGKTKWVAKTDPPPDLGVEVDITHSVINRMGIYAALRVPEIWRFKKKIIRVYLLGEKGAYQESEGSAIFPYLDMNKLNEFLQAASTTDETTLLRSFSEWVRKEVLPLTQGRRNGKKANKS